jgi:hypothetical protein
MTWDIYAWCRENRVTLQAVHIPGEKNLLADKLSRQLCSPTESEINIQVIHKLFHLWGRPDVDLFATFENRELPQFFPISRHCIKMLWQSAGKGCLHTLSLLWQILNQVLNKIAREPAKIILIAPIWTRREWYPLLLDLVVDYPYHLPVMKKLVNQEQGSLLHHNPTELCLGAWLLSTIPSFRGAFLRELQNTCISDKSENTHRAYQSSWNHFSAWCQRQGHNPNDTSVNTIMDYLQDNLDQGKAFFYCQS